MAKPHLTPDASAAILAERDKLAADLKQAIADRDAWSSAASKRSTEISALQRKLHDSEMARARLEGFIDRIREQDSDRKRPIVHTIEPKPDDGHYRGDYFHERDDGPHWTSFGR